MHPIRFQPLYMPRVWGGHTLESVFGRSLPAGAIGESWELVDREKDQSVVADGPYTGLTLRELCDKHGTEVLKENWQAGRRFPLIVKWLDCKDRLSLQVHPPENVAKELSGEPKSECWAVVKAAPDAGIFVGFAKPTAKEAFEKAVKEKRAEAMLHRIATQKDDFIFIPSGRLHAIDGGNLILEIQQNSDTTYRVYDWGRPREIHLEQALRSIDFDDVAVKVARTENKKNETLLTHPLFTLKRMRLHAGEQATLAFEHSARILSLTEGEIACGGQVYRAGENLLLPRGAPYTISASKNSILIITSNFL